MTDKTNMSENRGSEFQANLELTPLLGQNTLKEGVYKPVAARSPKPWWYPTLFIFAIVPVAFYSLSCLLVFLWVTFSWS